MQLESALFKRRVVLWSCSIAHAVQDGLGAAVYVLLPILSQTLGLSYGQVGLFKGLKSLAQGLLEIASGVACERFGERWLLVFGLGLASAEEVAERTIACLLECVPAEVPGIAFLSAQLLDVGIFDRLREGAWWRAPVVSTLIGSTIDTALFFTIAFSSWLVALEPANDVSWANEMLPMLGSGPLAPLWMSLAVADWCIKVAIALIALIPFRLIVARMVAPVSSPFWSLT